MNCFPILTDEGAGLALFSKKLELKQFLCFRHILEKIGSGTYIAQIVKRLLFLPKLENFQAEISQAISDINKLILNNKISQKSAKQFAKIFELYIGNDNFLHPNPVNNLKMDCGIVKKLAFPLVRIM